MGGTRSALMNGAVIGGVRDNSAAYYNPAGLAFINKTSHSISSDNYQWENITIKNGLGKNADFRSNQIQIIPTLVSGIFEVDFLPWLRLGYSIAAKDFSFIKASALHEAQFDVINKIDNGMYIGNGQFVPLFDGEEKFSGQFLYDAAITEYWGGLSWANKINEDFAFGITLFTVYRSHSESHNINAFATDKSYLRTASNQILNSIEYWNFRVVPKIGITWNVDDIKAGITLTAPSINIIGQATINGIITSRNIRYEINEANVDIPIDLIVSHRKQDLASLYKSPLSIGFGMEFALFQNTTLAISSEYFTEIQEYKIVNSDVITFPDDSEIDFSLFGKNWLKFSDRKNSVFNTAVAFEYKYNEVITAYTGFRTNYRNNKKKPVNGIEPGISDWDIYHASIGALYKLYNQEISLAFRGSFGSNNNFKQLTNFSGEAKSTNELFILGENGRTTANYWLLGISLGFTYYLD